MYLLNDVQFVCPQADLILSHAQYMRYYNPCLLHESLYYNYIWFNKKKLELYLTIVFSIKNTMYSIKLFFV